MPVSDPEEDPDPDMGEPDGVPPTGCLLLTAPEGPKVSEPPPAPAEPPLEGLAVVPVPPGDCADPVTEPELPLPPPLPLPLLLPLPLPLAVELLLPPGMVALSDPDIGTGAAVTVVSEPAAPEEEPEFPVV